MSGHIRSTAKAVIRQGSKLLFIRLCYDDGDFYDLPGGGQRFEETLPEALMRECNEELGAQIEVGDVLYVYEFFSDRHLRTRHMPETHALKVAFSCKLLTPINDTLTADYCQQGAVWLDIDKLDAYPIHPSSLPLVLAAKEKKIYLGEVL